MEVLAVIGIVIFMIINLVIYHKIFSVTYFNLANGCFTEIFFAWLVAMLEMGIILAVGKFILGGILKFLGFAGKIIIIVLVISLVLFAVSKIVQLIKGKDTEEADKANNDFIQNDEVNEDEKEESEAIPLDVEVVTYDAGTEESGAILEKQSNIRMMVCTSCGKAINENDKFCYFCGNKITKMDMTVCANCGKPITENAKFCYYCGEKIKKG